MVSRRIAYWIDYVSSPYKLFCWMGWDAVRRFLIVQSKLEQVGGITMANCTLRRDLDDVFVQTTRAALGLIQRRDPRRFRMVEREVRLIVNQALLSSGGYDRSTRQCQVNFKRCWVDIDGRFYADPQMEGYEWYLARYSSLIVHEAVHGRLHSLHFPYIKNTRLQIERICVTEQRRFLARLPQDGYDFEAMVPAFDPQRWEATWHMGRWERFKRLTRSLREKGSS